MKLGSLQVVWLAIAEERSVEQMWRRQNYDWPGNAREVENVIEGAMILSGGENQALNLCLIPPDGEAEVSSQSFAAVQTSAAAFVTQAEWGKFEGE